MGAKVFETFVTLVVVALHSVIRINFKVYFGSSEGEFEIIIMTLKPNIRENMSLVEISNLLISLNNDELNNRSSSLLAVCNTFYASCQTNILYV